jgi:hypothetical protein
MSGNRTVSAGCRAMHVHALPRSSGTLLLERKGLTIQTEISAVSGEHKVSSGPHSQ